MGATLGASGLGRVDVSRWCGKHPEPTPNATVLIVISVIRAKVPRGECRFHPSELRYN